jgi:hypothetical protein
VRQSTLSPDQRRYSAVSLLYFPAVLVAPPDIGTGLHADSHHSAFTGRNKWRGGFQLASTVGRSKGSATRRLVLFNGLARNIGGFGKLERRCGTRCLRHCSITLHGDSLGGDDVDIGGPNARRDAWNGDYDDR